MPALCIQKNGIHVCTVGSDDMWMFSAGVSADIWSVEIASLDVSGGTHRTDDDSDFLIWETDDALTTSDRITFQFEESSKSVPKGAIFDPDDYPAEEAKFNLSTPPTDEDLTELESRLAINADVIWSVSINGASSIEVAPDQDRQFISLRLEWTNRLPEILRVNLKKFSVREALSRSDGKEIFRGHIAIGDSIEVLIKP